MTDTVPDPVAAEPDAPAPRPDLDSPNLVTSLTHLYRGEMNRLTVWRQRLGPRERHPGGQR